MESVQTLIDMGFPENKAQKAMQLCSNNVEQAMEWLLAHIEDSAAELTSDAKKTNADNPEEKMDEANESSGTTEKNPSNSNDEAEGEAEAEAEADAAKSIKCDECERLFKTSEEVEFHAVKSGHSSFSESTEEKRVLSEDERKEKLKVLETKIKQRRVEKEEEQRIETIVKEKKRIQHSREYTDMKKKNEEMEVKKLLEERKREKLEDKLARQRVKDQIECDRRARKEREQWFSGTGPPAPPPTTPLQPAGQSSSTQVTQKKDYDSTKLQIRLPTGVPLVQNFNSKEPLSAVRLWVSLNRTDGIPSDVPFKLSTTFPRKIFTEDDMDKPLSLLGLVPSSVLAVTK